MHFHNLVLVVLDVPVVLFFSRLAKSPSSRYYSDMSQFAIRLAAAMLAAQCAAGEAAGLARFGTALEAHVRFEERELFPLAEAVLTPRELARCAG